MWNRHHGVGTCPSRPEDVRGRSLPDDVPPGAAKSPPRWSSGTRDLLRHARVPPARAGGSGNLRIQPSEPLAAPGGPDSRSALGVESSPTGRSEEHTSELQSQSNLVCRLLLEKKKKIY